MKGRLIVLDGIDGSGKKTQVVHLIKNLKEKGFQVETVSFPQYGKKPAGLVEEYLNGKYGSPDEVGPYRASIFYACDRYDASFQIGAWLKEGKIVVLDRYVTANAGHQGGKIADHQKREQYLQWLYELEYFIFDIPKPDVNVILNLEPAIAQSRKFKGEKRGYIENASVDIHEKDLEHLKNSQRAFLWLAAKYPHEFRVVNCVENGRELTEIEITQKIWQVIEPFLRLNTGEGDFA